MNMLLQTRTRPRTWIAIAAAMAGAILALPGDAPLTTLAQQARDARADAPAAESADARTSREDANTDSASSLNKPHWSVGDSWTIVTLTTPLQERAAEVAGQPGKIPWRFEVKGLEKIGGVECYRIDVECQARGRLRPKTTIWCDRQTLFLRQFKTQVAAGGQYQTIYESYQPGQDGHAPVLTPLNALPIALPAFLPEGSKRASKSFAYISRPLPAGAKDLDIVSFSHRTTQEVAAPSERALKQVPESYTKNLAEQPLAEVRLKDHAAAVVQLWQKDVPWPVYVDNGSTQAWLVSDHTDR
jgi:hypothetical protein